MTAAVNCAVSGCAGTEALAAATGSRQRAQSPPRTQAVTDATMPNERLRNFMVSGPPAGRWTGGKVYRDSRCLPTNPRWFCSVNSEFGGLNGPTPIDGRLAPEGG